MIGRSPSGFRRSGERLESRLKHALTLGDVRRELALREDAAAGEYLTGEFSAADLAVYPFMAVVVRVAGHRADFAKDEVVGPHLAAWIDRMQIFPIVQRTRPPHWK